MNKTDTNVQEPDLRDLLAKPAVGTFFVIASGLSFLGVLITLPLVGQAGSAVSYAGRNATTFITVLLVAMTFAGCAIGSKMMRRKVDQSPLPLTSIGLMGMYIVLLLVFAAGLLKI